MKVHKPTCDYGVKLNATMRNYDERYTEIMGTAKYHLKKALEPCAKDTNQTRRPMVKPTDKGTWE